MTDQDKMNRIREICLHYQNILRNASKNEKLEHNTRKMVNKTRHQALTEICELVRT